MPDAVGGGVYLAAACYPLAPMRGLTRLHPIPGRFVGASLAWFAVVSTPALARFEPSANAAAQVPAQQPAAAPEDTALSQTLNGLETFKVSERNRSALFAEWEGQIKPQWKGLLGARVERVTMDAGDVVGYNPAGGGNQAKEQPQACRKDHHP